LLDFHSHILPNVDDGSKSLEETIEMINFLKSNNFTGVVATPHANSLYFPKREKLNELREEILKKVNFKIIIGYEVRIDTIKVYDPRNFLIEGTNYILLEFDFLKKPKDILEPFIEVLKLGIKPIFAHPERYNYLSIDEVKEIKNMGVLIQVNLKSILGFYGEGIKRKAIEIYNFCDLIGSDAHSINDYKNLSKFELYKDKNFSILM